MTDAEYQELHSEWTATMTDNANALPIQERLRDPIYDAGEDGLPYLVEKATEDVMDEAADRIDALEKALREAVDTITDYVEYHHSGDPWEEDARTMGEMDINAYARDGRLAAARAALGE